MPVTGVDLGVPDPSTARRLFVDLLGGAPIAGSVGSGAGVARQPGGAVVRWDHVPGPRSRLSALAVGVEEPDRVVAALAGRGATLRPDGDGWRFAAEVLGVEVVVHDAGSRMVVDGGPADQGPPGDPRGHGGAGTRVFDHVCLAVPSLADAVDLLCTRMGGEVVFGGHNSELGTLSSQVRFGSGTKVELLQPTRPDAALARFLDRRGPGAHHLTWYVRDVEAAARAAVEHGFAVVDTDLDRRAHWRETYLRPSSALGLLVQLAWTDRRHDTPLDDDTVAAILGGEVDSWGYTMHPPTHLDVPRPTRVDRPRSD